MAATPNGQSEALKRVCNALDARYAAGMAGRTEELMRLLDPTYMPRAEMSDAPPYEEHCHAAIKCKNVLASAHTDYIMPPGQRWFTLQPRDKKSPRERTKVREWYEKATEITSQALGDSNFYLEIQQAFDDRCGPATGCMFIGGDETHELHFEHIPFGTYRLGEDDKGMVNTLMRRFRYTAEQAAERWGHDALPQKAQNDFAEESRRYTQTREYIHLVLPRAGAMNRASEMLPEEQRMFAGYYLDAEDYSIIAEESWYEFPYFVTRFAKGNAGPYGVGPGHEVLPSIKRLMRLEKVMDALGEQAAFPPMMQLAEQNQQIDMRAGAINTISMEAAAAQMPRPLFNGGRYEVGKDRVEECKRDIQEAFFVDMLLSISNVDRDMTATEVEERVNEKVLAFSPSFVRLIYEFRPAMHRIISVLYRRNAYPAEGMPPDLFRTGPDGKVQVLNPTISYTGKIAQAVERVMQRGVDLVLDKIVAYTQSTGDTSMIDRLDAGAIVVAWLEGAGAPTEMMVSEKEYKARLAQRQAAAEEARALEMAQAQADQNQKNAGAMRQMKGGAR